MFTLSMDEWDGVYCKALTFALVPDDECTRFVAQLDGAKHTCFSVVPNANEDFMMVVGGGCGQFIVTKQVGWERFWTLINPRPKLVDRVSLCVGGQFGDYEPRSIVDVDLANRAVRELVSGQVDDGLLWVLDACSEPEA